MVFCLMMAANGDAEAATDELELEVARDGSADSGNVARHGLHTRCGPTKPSDVRSARVLEQLSHTTLPHA